MSDHEVASDTQRAHASTHEVVLLQALHDSGRHVGLLCLTSDTKRRSGPRRLEPNAGPSSAHTARAAASKVGGGVDTHACHGALCGL